MTLLGNTIRSWVFVRDIDNNYRGMVEARKNFFKRNDLTDETRYLASTGIEGKSRNVNSLVSIDLLSISDLSPRQIVRMEARANMSPTIDYGVTFERGCGYGSAIARTFMCRVPPASIKKAMFCTREM